MLINMFDMFLLFALPSLWYFALAVNDFVVLGIISVLIAIHIVIAFYRYCRHEEFAWETWQEFVAIVMGIGIGVSALSHGDKLYKAVMIITAFVIVYGHVRKLLKPELPYYYGQAKGQANVYTDSSV
tara:strand:+ start:5976 stop:6356 length:381 start_codon:yes stop_codon:yes gene_type:complete